MVSRCPNCCIQKRGAAKSKNAGEKFLEKVKELVGDEYNVMSEYVKSDYKITMRHNTCGLIYKVTPNHFLNNRRCPQCANLRRSEKHMAPENWFAEKVEELTSGEFTVLGEYTGIHNKIKIRHNSDFCNYREFEMRPSLFLYKGHRCDICSAHTVTNESFKKAFNLKFGKYGFNIASDFKTTDERIKILHNCGIEFERNRKNLNVFAPDNGDVLLCPNCDYGNSRSNKFIYSFLKEHNINFVSEASFDWCVFKMPLRFDFQIFKKNSTEFILLEFQGTQHTQLIEHWGGENDFKLRQTRDKIKKEKCKEKNIELILLNNPLTLKEDLEKIISSL
jgi:hypothetical protein